MERRVVFSGWLFPVLLLLPQLAVTVVFFFWPAAQAILQSVRREDAFGLSTRFVAAENFTAVLGDPFYLASAEITVLFSPSIGIVAVALRRLGIDWNYLLDAPQAMLLVVLAATWKQISYNFLFF